jgi:hypothetical protein
MVFISVLCAPSNETGFHAPNANAQCQTREDNYDDDDDEEEEEEEEEDHSVTERLNSQC